MRAPEVNSVTDLLNSVLVDRAREEKESTNTTLGNNRFGEQIVCRCLSLSLVNSKTKSVYLSYGPEQEEVLSTPKMRINMS